MLGLESVHPVGKTKDHLPRAHSRGARVGHATLRDAAIARTELKIRSQSEHVVTHKQLGCAPKRADHMVTAYGAPPQPDTSMLLMLHTGRRSMKGGLCGSTHEHTQQPCKRLQKTLACCAPGSHFHAVIHETIAGALSHAVVIECRESCTNEHRFRESHRPATPHSKETCW